MILRHFDKIRHMQIGKGAVGCYTSMNGTGEVITLASGNSIQLPSTFSVATWTVWFKITGDALLFRGYDGGTDRGFFLHRVAASGFRMVLPNINGSFLSAGRVYSGATLTDNQWHNATGVFDSTIGRLDFYADGVLSNGALIGSPNIPVVNNSTLNAVGFPSTSQDIAQYGVWDRALSSVEVADIFSRTRFSSSYADIPNLTYHIIANILDPIDTVSGSLTTSDNMDGSNIICT